jgi:hypothetical protein
VACVFSLVAELVSRFLQEEMDRLEAWVRVKSRKPFSEGRQHPVLQNGDGADVESGSE